MRHGLAAVAAVVDHDAITGFGDAEFPGQSGGGQQQVAEGGLGGGGRFTDSGKAESCFRPCITPARAKSGAAPASSAAASQWKKPWAGRAEQSRAKSRAAALTKAGSPGARSAASGRLLVMAASICWAR